MEIPPLKTFIIYARADTHFKDALRRQLKPLEQLQLLDVWDDSHLLPGEEWEKSIEHKLDESHLIVMLVSESSLFSDFIQKKELKTALERKKQGITQFIPILVRDCLWDILPDFKTVQMLPLDEKRSILAVEAWISQSSAWAAALRELHKLIPDIQKKIVTDTKAKEDAKRAEAEAVKQKEESEKTEKLRHKRDEAAWKKVLAEVTAALSIEEKLEIYQTYLEDHYDHREEAESAIHELQSEQEMARKLKEKRERLEQQRREEQHRQEREQADHAAFAAARTRADFEAYLKKHTLHTTEAKQKVAAFKKEEEDKAAEKARHEAAERQKREAEEARAKNLPEMILIKGGTFDMGDTFGEGFDSEKPVHKVTLSDFYLGKYAVTFEEYDRFCEETKREKPGDQGWGRGKRPAINVSWDDAQAYCKWLSDKSGLPFRLPTEAEWECAARAAPSPDGKGQGGAKVRFGNGKDIADPAEINFYGKEDRKQSYSIVGEYRGKTVPVDSFQPNALGLHQMSGNVWEWCEDWYGAYPSSAQTNPAGPVSGSDRVVRGGSWNNNPQNVRAANRNNPESSGPGNRNNNLGFRLARTK